LCATTLLQHKDDFSPFIEFTEEAPCFETYVERLRNSADWGGHVELRVLSLALKRSIIVYSALPPSPLSIPFDEKVGSEKNEEPIRLSYHLHYYSLGEHYNCVMPKVNHDDDDQQQE
jgi:OTU domain-containing protein 6